MTQLTQFHYLSGLFILLGSIALFMSMDNEKSEPEPWFVLALGETNEVSKFYPDLPKVHDQVNFYSLVGQGKNFYMAASETEFLQLSQISQSVCNLSRSMAHVQVYYCTVNETAEKQNPLNQRVFDN